MKKTKKLSLNKETISKLNNEDMSALKGGLAAATSGKQAQLDAQVACTTGTVASVVSIVASLISIIKDTLTPSPSPQPPIDCCGTVIVQK